MSRTIKILIALTALVLLWKLALGGSSAEDVEVEYEPAE